MASFPTSAKTFATRSNGQIIDGSHVQDLQDEVAALEDGYLNGAARLNSSNSTVANLSVVGGSTVAALHVTSTATFDGNVTITGTLTASGGLSKPFIVFTPAHNQPPASAYATLDTRNNHLVLDFDGSTDEEAIFPGVLPVGYSGGGLAVDIYVAFTSATSGSVRFQADIERIDTSSLDIDSDGFTGTFQSAGGTAPGTSGQVIKVTITFTAGSQMDSLAAGEAFRLKIRRDADGTSGTDDITTDAEVLRVVVRET